jgi:hypothetical protein
MKTIKTTHLGPTNTRGSRIKASDEDGNSITLPYKSELNSNQCHMEAAVALCEKMDWIGMLHGGHTKNGMTWVFHDRDLIATVTRPKVAK